MKSIITSNSFDYLGEDISKELDIKKARVDIDTFADGWPSINIVSEDVKNKVTTVLLDFSQKEDFFSNYALLQGLVNYKVDSLNIVMPYYPVGTMERIGKPGEVPTAHSFANIISGLPTGKSGRKNNLSILDIHAEVEEYLFSGNNISVDSLTMMESLEENFKGKTIVFPDEGAKKRFSKYFENYDKVVCSKTRKGEDRIITISEGNVKGKDLIIVDDMIQTGGTIVKTSDKLRELGAKSVSCYATHGIFPGDSHLKISKSLDNIIVTDSIPKNIIRSEQVDNMQVISIKNIIKEIIIKG